MGEGGWVAVAPHQCYVRAPANYQRHAPKPPERDSAAGRNRRATSLWGEGIRTAVGRERCSVQTPRPPRPEDRLPGLPESRAAGLQRQDGRRSRKSRVHQPGCVAPGLTAAARKHSIHRCTPQRDRRHFPGWEHGGNMSAAPHCISGSSGPDHSSNSSAAAPAGRRPAGPVHCTRRGLLQPAAARSRSPAASKALLAVPASDTFVPPLLLCALILPRIIGSGNTQLDRKQILTN